MKIYRVYPKCRPSGVEWLGEVPEHWDVLALKRIVSTPITDGPHETPEIFDEGIPFVSAEAIKNDKIDFKKIRGFISLEDHKKYSQKYKPQRNDVFIIKSGATTGNVAIVETDEEFNIWSPLAAIRPNQEISSPRFLFHFVRAKEFMTSIQLGWSFGTQQNIGMNVIENLVVTRPPLLEQQSIAAFLDRETEQIDSLVAKKERLIDLLREKRTALISHAVTKGLNPSVKLKPSGVEWLGDVPEHWVVKNIKWETPVLRGASPRPIDDQIYFDDDGEYAWVRIADVTDSQGYLHETTQKLSEIGASLSVKLNPGSLFLSIAATVGVPCITRIKCCIHDGFVYFPQLKADVKFMYYIFACGEPYKGLGKLGTQLNLNTDTVGSIKVGFPPIPEQQGIAAFLDHETAKIDALITKVESAITKLKEYRTTLISAAVTGKIDVREAL